MGFEIKRLQSSVDSYLCKTLNIHTRLPVVSWKKKIHLQAETYHSKQITPTCLEDSRLKVAGKSHLCCVTRHPVWAKIITYIYWDVCGWNARKCILSDVRQSNRGNIIQEHLTLLQKRWMMLSSLCVILLESSPIKNMPNFISVADRWILK